MIFQYHFSWHMKMFAFFQYLPIFQINSPKSEEKLNFGGRWAECLWIRLPLQTKLVTTPLDEYNGCPLINETDFELLGISPSYFRRSSSNFQLWYIGTLSHSVNHGHQSTAICGAHVQTDTPNHRGQHLWVDFLQGDGEYSFQSMCLRGRNSVFSINILL